MASSGDIFDKTLFDIDLNKLEEHWADQSKLTREITSRLARVNLDIGEKEEELAVRTAQIEYDIRTNPQAWNIEKITEGAIKNCTADHADLLKISKELRKLNYLKDLLKGVSASLQDRKSALENLVKLHGQDYFSVPYVAGPSGKKMTDAEKKQTRRPIRRKRK